MLDFLKLNLRIRRILFGISITALLIMIVEQNRLKLSSLGEEEDSKEILVNDLRLTAQDFQNINEYLTLLRVIPEDIKANLDNPNWFLTKILTFANSIVQLPQDQLAPSPLSNTLFSGLVTLVREFPNFDPSLVVNNRDLRTIQPILLQQCSTAEYLLEASFAREIQSGEKFLKEFIYYENYQLLIAFEMKSLKTYLESMGHLDHKIRKVAIIGSGPLPLTSVELLRHLPKNASVINYDMSQEAIALGQIVVNSSPQDTFLDMKKISFECKDALDLNKEDMEGVDVVYLAALVGSDSTTKTIVMDHLYKIMEPGAVLVARSSFGLRTIIYHQITPQEFQSFEGFKQFDPSDKVILNSIAIGIRGD